MKKISFMLLLCALCVWSNQSFAQTLRVAGFWPEEAMDRYGTSGIPLSATGNPNFVKNIPIPVGANKSRITIAVEHSGFGGGTLSGNEIFMEIHIVDAVTGSTVASLLRRYPNNSAHPNAVITNTYTAAGSLGPPATYANITMDVPSIGLVSGRAYKVKFVVDPPHPTISYSNTSTSSATFYSDFSTRPSLGPDVNASSYDASSMAPLFVTAGGTTPLTDYIWFEWYIGTLVISAGYQPYDNTTFITIPPITATSATGWTFTSSYPAFQATLTNITSDMTMRLNVWAGSNIGTFKVQYGDVLNINVPSPAPAKPSKSSGSLLDAASNNLDIYPNPVQNEFTVKLNALSNADKVEVYNMMGQLVSTVPVTEGQTSVNVQAAEWNKGMYFVKLYAKDELVGSEKILKAE